MKYYVSEPAVGYLEEDNVMRALRAKRLTQGRVVEFFERTLRHALDRHQFVVACSSGTSALHLALLAAGVGPGDEVLVPNLSFVATANAVKYCGATPVLCDINRTRWDIDPSDGAVTRRTKAMIVVHLYGNVADMDAARRFCGRHQLLLIEDAAQGLGAFYNNHAVGTLADVGTFSFYGNKIITTGEGGALITRRANLAARARHLRGQAMTQERFFHDEVGYNYRMTDVHAAIGCAQVERFTSLLVARERVCSLYRSLFRGFETTHEDSAPWLFTLVLPDGVERGDVMTRLAVTHRIETRPGFVPMHQLPAFAWYHADGHKLRDVDFPVSSYLSRRFLSLPTHPGLTDDDVYEIAGAVLEAVNE